MTQHEIQECNKEISLMLNYMHNIRFDKDWNHLMEAVEFVENLNVEYSVEIIRATCVIRHFNTIFSAQYFKKERDKKEAVFIAVSDFAKKFNNKEL